MPSFKNVKCECEECFMRLRGVSLLPNAVYSSKWYINWISMTNGI